MNYLFKGEKKQGIFRWNYEKFLEITVRIKDGPWWVKLERKTAELTKSAVINRLEDHFCLSLTVDNGTEHTEHEDIASQLKAPIYFCHPFHSWEKGSNENFNGLIRRYLPRGRSIQEVTQEDIDDIVWELNNRPRKVLGFRTPTEVLKSEYRKLNIVAFGIRL